ncbi:MAG: hypothetical protein ACAH27_05770 [Xanthobacteraceae bacterium]
MAKFDLHNNIHVVPLLQPVVAATTNTAIVSAIIDTLGYGSVELVLVAGANTDADVTFAVTVHDGDVSNLSDATAVAAAELLGTLAQAGFQFDDDGECRKIGYVGNKRYVRLTITPAGNDSGNIYVAGVAVLGNPVLRPTANPPQ